MEISHEIKKRRTELNITQEGSVAKFSKKSILV